MCLLPSFRYHTFSGTYVPAITLIRFGCAIDDWAQPLASSESKELELLLSCERDAGCRSSAFTDWLPSNFFRYDLHSISPVAFPSDGLLLQCRCLHLSAVLGLGTRLHFPS